MHPSNKISKENLCKAVYGNPTTAEKEKKYKAISDASYALIKTILEESPECDNRSCALRSVREARIWAIASIALDEK